jgi:hypothetical protein
VGSFESVSCGSAALDVPALRKEAGNNSKTGE